MSPRAFGADTYASGTYGGGSPDAAITTTTVPARVSVPLPHIPGRVTGIDITYLIASHDPSVVLRAASGLRLTAGHIPSYPFTVRRGDRLSLGAGVRPSYTRRASHRPSISKRGTA